MDARAAARQAGPGGSPGAEPRRAPAPPSGADVLLPPPARLEELFALRPATYLRRVPGRETFVWPERPELVVKRYRGDAPREWWAERRAGRARSPARREAENLAALLAAGFAVPRALGLAEEPRAGAHPRLGGRGARSAVVLERIPHAETLRERLEARGERACRAELALLAGLVGALHARGWYHRDLYLEHVVVDARNGRLVVLDWARARRAERPGRRWLVKDLAALLLSTEASVTDRTRLRFLVRWLRATGRDPGELGRWARAVRAKARGLGRHLPRHVHAEPSVAADPRVREHHIRGGAG